MFDYCGIITNEKKLKKIFFEVITNTKIIKIFSMKLPTTKILSNLQGTRQKGTGQRRIR